jgi:hypothetical protein
MSKSGGEGGGGGEIRDAAIRRRWDHAPSQPKQTSEYDGKGAKGSEDMDETGTDATTHQGRSAAEMVEMREAKRRRRTVSRGVSGRKPRPCVEGFVGDGGARGLCARCGWGAYPHTVASDVNKRPSFTGKKRQPTKKLPPLQSGDDDEAD